MGYIVLAIFLGLIALGCIGGAFAVRGRTRRDNPAARPVLFSVGALFLVINFLVFAFVGMVTVPVNTTGVPQAFGAVSGSEMAPGVHWTFEPWLTVTNIDETVQTTHFTGTIRIGGQQTAQANIKIKWQIRPPAADALFKQYANQGPLMTTVTNNVVLLDLENVVNNVMGDYDPITDVSSVANSNGTQSLFTTFGPEILKDMRADIGSQINVIQLTMPNLQYSSAVETKLQAIQQAYANYAIAQENVKVNAETALGLQKLGTPSESELAAECLTDLKDGMDAPTGFQCMPGASSNLALSGS